jgi:hypothetical protein
MHLKKDPRHLVTFMSHVGWFGACGMVRGMWDGPGHEGWSGANYLSRSNRILKNIYPRQKQFWPGIKQFWPGLKQICSGSPTQSVPIRLNVYEEELSLIGTKFGSPEVISKGFFRALTLSFTFLALFS